LEAEVFAYESESKQKVLQALLNLFPFKDAVREELLKGAFGTKIVVFRGKVSKDKVKKFFSNLKKRLSKAAREEVISEVEERVDERGNLFLRFDKQEAFLGRASLITGGDCILVKIHSRADRRRASEVLKQTLEELLKG
jgi:hypothetical protein